MKTPALAAILLAHVLALAACGQSNDPTAGASTGPRQPASASASAQPPAASAPASPVPSSPLAAPKSLADRLDCVRKAGGVLIIGHRGGPTRDFPANAIETLERTYHAGTHAAEVDVSQTSDGKLFLFHDDMLDKLSTGRGPVAEHTWAEISLLKLQMGSKTTGFHPALLDDVLAWAVRNHALLELDHKPPIGLDAIIAAVRTAKAQNNVLLFTYTDAQASEVAQKAPELTITATVNSPADVDALASNGVSPSNLVAWTGTSAPRADLWKALSDRGVEASFGTPGPRGASLDSNYWEDHDGSEYDALVRDGLPILVTDLTDKVSRELAGPREKAEGCGI